MNLYEFRDGFNINSKIEDAISNVVKSNKFILGDNVKMFEENLEKYLGVKYAIATSSGTDALTIAYKSIGVNILTNVITTPYTLQATFSGAKNLGSKIYFSRVSKDTFNMDVNSAIDLIDPGTACIVPVHLFGQCCEMDKFNTNITIIEDACQALGAKYKGKKAGTIGKIGCFSFYPAKIVGAYGDAGAIVTNEEKLYDIMLSLRNHGRSKRNKYIYDYTGYCSRMDEIQAVVLNVKLNYLDDIINLHRSAAQYYSDNLQDVCEIPKESVNNFHTFHRYVIKSSKRNSMIKIFKKYNIGYEIYYPAPFSGKCLDLSERSLSLPIFPFITQGEQDTVIGLVRKVSK